MDSTKHLSLSELQRSVKARLEERAAQEQQAAQKKSRASSL